MGKRGNGETGQGLDGRNGRFIRGTKFPLSIYVIKPYLPVIQCPRRRPLHLPRDTALLKLFGLKIKQSG